MPLTEEERRRNRMMSNRLSARRSRAKRQQQEVDLAAYAAQLALDNEAMRATTGVVMQHYGLVEEANRVLSADARHLYSELQLRNSQLRFLGQITDMPMDVPEIPSHLTQLYGGLQVPLPPPSLSPSLPLLPPSLPMLPLSLSLPLQPPPSLSLPLSVPLQPPASPSLPLSRPSQFPMLFQPEPDQSDEFKDDEISLPWL